MSEKPFLRAGVRLSIAVQDKEGSWRKREFWIESDVPAGMTAVDAVHELEHSLEPKIEGFPATVKPPQPGVTGPPPAMPPSFQQASAEPEPTPELDPSFLDKLPWTPYERSVGGWNFSDIPQLKRLCGELLKAPGPLVLGEYRYKFSGSKDEITEIPRFISRYPVAKA